MVTNHTPVTASPRSTGRLAKLMLRWIDWSLGVLTRWRQTLASPIEVTVTLDGRYERYASDRYTRLRKIR